jgi:hypothetical protein
LIAWIGIERRSPWEQGLLLCSGHWFGVERNRRSLGFARDDKGKGKGSIESGCWTEAFFITWVGRGPRTPRPERSGVERSAVFCPSALLCLVVGRIIKVQA